MSEYPIEGSCQCGKVTYLVKAPPVYIAACNCKQCQKQSGSAFGISLILSRDSLELSGDLKTWECRADSGAIKHLHFCPDCGNRIYHSDPDRPDFVRLKAGTLTDTSIIKPLMFTWKSEKQNWFTIPEEIEVHETQPEW